MNRLNRLRINKKNRVSSHLILALSALLIGVVVVSCKPISDAATTEPNAPDAANTALESPLAAASSATATATAIPSPLSTGEVQSAGELAPAQRDGMYEGPPEMLIDPEKYYYATIRTEKGDMKVQLFADRAPMTVNNFVFLARDSYFSDTTFHRVIEGFMAQAGDPAATGGGGPGYMFEDEIVPGLSFDQRGILAMANRGPATNGSQFFITFAPTEWLDGNHTIFGKVIEGEEVLDEITRIDPDVDFGKTGDAVFSIEIEESDVSILPTPTLSPPTPTPTPTPTPFAPSDLSADDRPLAAMEPAERVGYFNSPPVMTIDEDAAYQATIATTQGDIVIDLYAKEAPVSVNNFVVLANLGFYDNTPINFVGPEDYVVFGSPDNQQSSDAGYQIPAELNADLSMNLGVFGYLPVENFTGGNTLLSSSSQILISLIDPPDEAAAQLGFFAQIIEGDDVLFKLTVDDMIESITVTASD